MENTISSQTTNYIIVGNKDGLFFDPNSLQRYVTIQGADNSDRPQFSEALSNSSPANNNDKTNGEILVCENGSMLQSQYYDVNCPMQEISMLKKPCPLEMSIKAADLDTEFNDNCLYVQDESGQYVQLIEDRAILNSTIHGQQFNHSQNPFSSNNEVQFSIHENLNEMQVVFQPDTADNIIENNYVCFNNESNPTEYTINCELSTKGNSNGISEHENEKMICEVVKRKRKTKEGKESVPLVLTIRKVKRRIKRRKRFDDEEWESVKKKPKEKRIKRVKPVTFVYSDWDSSDDETLDATSRRLQTIETPVARCCNKKCNKKIPPSQQDVAYLYFTELEKLGQGDRYLGNCVHLKITSPQPGESNFEYDEIEAPLSPWPNYDQISEEIANESNGNQLLSDEIKNAINESLKDQESSNTELAEVKTTPTVQLNSKKPNEVLENYNALIWTYFVVARNRQRPVCLNFLMKTLNVTESRIEKVRKRILSGDELDRISVCPTRSKLRRSWNVASQHIESLSTYPVPYCRKSPPHMYFVKPIDRRTLYRKFCRYHQIVTGSDSVPKLESYRRFLLMKSNIAFPRQKETSCAGCDYNRAPTEIINVSHKLPDPPDRKKRKKNESPIKPSKLKPKKPIKLSKKKLSLKKTQRGDVFSLMLAHLKSLPAKIPADCTLCERHKFFSPNDTTVQSLYDDYRRYFLKCTNSELGLRFAIYESLFLRNPLFTIAHLDENSTECPKCGSADKTSNLTDATIAKK